MATMHTICVMYVEESNRRNQQGDVRIRLILEEVDRFRQDILRSTGDGPNSWNDGAEANSTEEDQHMSGSAGSGQQTTGRSPTDAPLPDS